jgi:hypothetical protein
MGFCGVPFVPSGGARGVREGPDDIIKGVPGGGG